MRSRRVFISLIVLAGVAAGGYLATPYVRSLLLVVRAADLGGPVEAFARREARLVRVQPMSVIPTRAGDVAARVYEPEGGFSRTVLLIPGIHAAGIDEPRLTTLARDLAGSGVAVMTIALPDLRDYLITPRSTDIIEDAIAWLSRQARFASDGRVGIVGVSFAGGLSIVAAGRPAVRDRVAFTVSFGGHGDLSRVMRYLCSGQEPAIEGLEARRPHDYGVAVVLYGIADTVVPAAQVQPLRDGVRTFLLASQQTLVDATLAARTFRSARDMALRLPEPAATYLNYVNTRNVTALGPVLLPHLAALATDDPALSPERAPSPPTAPVFLLHGAGDTVIPAAESALLRRYLDGHAPVRLLLSQLITHAEIDKSATTRETWKLVSFWADVLRH